MIWFSFLNEVISVKNKRKDGHAQIAATCRTCNSVARQNLRMEMKFMVDDDDEFTMLVACVLQEWVSRLWSVTGCSNKRVIQSTSHQRSRGMILIHLLVVMSRW